MNDITVRNYCLRTYTETSSAITLKGLCADAEAEFKLAFKLFFQIRSTISETPQQQLTTNN